MASRKKKAAPVPGHDYRPKRTAEGALLLTVRERGTTVPSERRFLASTVGAGAKRTAEGPTPRAAVDGVTGARREGGFVEAFEPYDAITARLLSTPWKAPGQDPGGAPVKRDEAATASFSLRMPARLKAQLQVYAATKRTTPAQVVLDALEAVLVNVGIGPVTPTAARRARRSTQ